VGNPEGKRPLERPRHRWKDGIKMDLRETGWVGGGVAWIHLAQHRDRWQALVNAVMNPQVLAPHSE
jgi:ABC-type Fe3+ transport system substrate-binding protein